jgi:hypothetical protein
MLLSSINSRFSKISLNWDAIELRRLFGLATCLWSSPMHSEIYSPFWLGNLLVIITDALRRLTVFCSFFLNRYLNHLWRGSIWTRRVLQVGRNGHSNFFSPKSSEYAMKIEWIFCSQNLKSNKGWNGSVPRTFFNQTKKNRMTPFLQPNIKTDPFYY